MAPSNAGEQRNDVRPMTMTEALAGACLVAHPDQVLRGPRGNRTHNPRIKSPLLCQLS